MHSKQGPDRSWNIGFVTIDLTKLLTMLSFLMKTEMTEIPQKNQLQVASGYPHPICLPLLPLGFLTNETICLIKPDKCIFFHDSSSKLKQSIAVG